MQLAAAIIVQTLTIYRYILIGRVVLSFIPLFKPGWSPPSALMPIVDLIYGLTEPPLQLLRRVIPQPMGFPLDISFIVLFLIVYVLQGFFVAAAGTV